MWVVSGVWVVVRKWVRVGGGEWEGERGWGRGRWCRGAVVGAWGWGWRVVWWGPGEVVMRRWVGGQGWRARKGEGWLGRGWVGEQVVVMVVGLGGQDAWE